MAGQLTDEQKAEYKETFALFDKNGDGSISSKELGTVMRSLGKFPSPEELEKMINEMDNDGSGCIEYEEFLTMMARNNMDKSRDQKSEVHESFRKLDKNGDGFISADELRQVMANLGEIVSYEDVQAMIKVADLDGDGKVNFDEFYAIVTSK